MKIAVIAHAHHAIKQPFVGGLEAHTYELIAELVNQGHDVTLYAKAGSNTDAQTQHVIFSGDAKTGMNPLYDKGYRQAMRHINSQDFDLIVNNSLNYTPMYIHNLTMAPMITVFHTPPFIELFTAVSKTQKVTNRTYIAVSEFTATQWQKYCVNPVHVVSNGINITHWQAKLLPHASIKAGWVGRITPEKGTHIAIEACLKAGIPLNLGGPIYDKAYFDAQIKPFLNDDNIVYHGHLDHAGVNALMMSAAIALVTPLWDEPFGLVEIEAWASGTPVAALPNGALPSLVRDDVGSLAMNNSAAALAMAMQQALGANRAACRRYAEQNFSLSVMVQSYLSLNPEDVYDDRTSLEWQIA